MKNILTAFILVALFLAACQPKQKPNLTPEETAEYLEKGKEVMKQSFMALSGQLAAAMQEGGVQHAVSYCNLKASPIMDSLAQVHQVKVSRVTNRPRNPLNMGNKDELETLGDYMKVQSGGETMVSFIQSSSREDVIFYAPIIIISPLCLKCHGEIGTDIAQEDYDLIYSLYPDDQATGYKMNEIRGLWKVEFN